MLEDSLFQILNMESTVLDNVRFEKEKAVARFNHFRRIVKMWQFFELLVVLGLVSWSCARLPAVMKVAGGYFVEFSAYVFDPFVVCIIMNFIIVSLFLICRRNEEALGLSGGGDGLYDDYVKHSEAVHQREPPPPPGNLVPAVDEKQIVVWSEEIKANPQPDEVVWSDDNTRNRERCRLVWSFLAHSGIRFIIAFIVLIVLF